jgi:hypothetical protein
VTLYAAPDRFAERDAHALRPRPISADSAAALRAARGRPHRSANPRADPRAALRAYAARRELGRSLFLLFASLFGSYINIPIAALDQETMATEREVTYFGMRYIVPVMVDSPGVIFP